MKDLTNWFDGFAKTAEASGITDPHEIQKLITFQKRAELAKKYPDKFESGYDEYVKKAQFGGSPSTGIGFAERGMPNMPVIPGQQMPTTLYSTPQGLTAQDVTPDVAHHAIRYGGAGALGAGFLGGIMRTLKGQNAGPVGHIAGSAAAGLTQPGKMVGEYLQNLGAFPTGKRYAILGAILAGLYGAGKGHFMQGRYGQGSQVGMTPEGYMNRMEPEIGRMKAIRQRLFGDFGVSPAMSPHAWYMYGQPGMGMGGQPGQGSNTW